MKTSRIAAALITLTLTASTAPALIAGPVAALTPESAQRGTGANVSFKAPAASSLMISKSGKCALPKFGWRVNTDYANSVFNGSARVVSGGKTYGSMSNARFSVNRDQTLSVSKPLCKPGKYTVIVKGKVTSDGPVDGGNVKTYKKVTGQKTYTVKKAS